jgi:hypothetical protein
VVFSAANSAASMPAGAAAAFGFSAFLGLSVTFTSSAFFAFSAALTSTAFFTSSTFFAPCRHVL